MRKKLGSKTPKVVLMTMTLAETLVKNGTTLVHGSIGNDLFMEEMARVARKYNGKLGADNREVAELSLDIIQAWGEGFAVRQQQFPAFTKYYHQLRREGLPFNPQFDASKVPEFAPPAASGASAQEAEDELMAQALAASMSGLSEGEEYGRRDSSPERYRDAPPPQRAPVQRMTYSELIATVNSNIGLTRDVVTASSPAELRSNDVASELVEQLSAYLELLVRAIDQAVVEQPEVK